MSTNITFESSSANNSSSSARGYELIVVAAPGINVHQTTNFPKFYSTYLLSPTLAIDFTLAELSGGITATRNGSEIRIINASATFSITVKSSVTLCVLRPGTNVTLVADSSWRVVNLLSSTRTFSGSGAPSALATDTTGDLYVDTSTPALYQYNGSAWTAFRSGTIAATAGGTGITTYTTGDTLYASAANTLSKLPIGTTGQFYRVTGGIPAWETVTGVQISAPSAGGLADTAIFINSAGNAIASRGITIDGKIGPMIDGFSGSSFGVGLEASGTQTTWCPDCKAFYGLLRTFSGVITLGSGFNFAGVGSGFETAIIKMSLDGTILWAARVARNTANETEPICIYHDEISHVTFLSMTVNNTGASFVYDAMDFHGSPIATLTYAGPAARKNCFVLKFNEQGRYIVDSTNPYNYTVNSRIVDFSRSVFSPNYMFNATTSHATTATLNTWSAPTFNYTGYGGFGCSRYDMVADRVLWIANITGGTNYIAETHITEDGRYLCHGSYSGPSGSLHDITDNLGVVTPANTPLPALPGTNYFNDIFFEVEPTTGVPKWVNMQFQNTLTFVGDYARSATKISDEGVFTGTTLFTTTSNFLTISRQVRVAVSFTSGLTAVTSSALFASSMSGQLIECSGVAAGTIFTYVDPSNGTLSVAATATKASVSALITNILPSATAVAINTTINTANVTSAAAFTQTMNGAYVSGTGIPTGSIFSYIDASNGRISQLATATGAIASSFSNIFSTVANAGTNAVVWKSTYDKWNFTTRFATISNTLDTYGRAFVDHYDHVYVQGYNYTGTITFTDGTTSTVGWAWVAKFSSSGTLLWVRIGDGTVIIFGEFLQIEDSFVSSVAMYASPSTIDGVTFSLTGGGSTFGTQYVFMTDNSRKMIGLGVSAANPTPVITGGIATTSATLVPGQTYYIDESNGGLTLTKYGNARIGRAVGANALLIGPIGNNV